MLSILRLIGLSIVFISLASCSASKEDWTKYFGEIKIVLNQQEKAMKGFEQKFSDLKDNRYLDANSKIKMINDIVAEIGTFQEKMTDYENQLDDISSPGDDRGLLESVKNLMSKQHEYIDAFKNNFGVVAESISKIMDIQMRAERGEAVSEGELDSSQIKAKEAMTNIDNFDVSAIKDLIEKCTVAQEKFFNETGIESEKIDFSKFK